MTTIRNIVSVLRREYTVRVRTRSFIFGTVLLLVAVLAFAYLPIVIRMVERTSQQQIAVHIAAADLQGDPVTTLTALLNATTEMGATDPDATPDFNISVVPDLAAARAAVDTGAYAAVLEIGRTAAGDVDFTLFTNDNASGRTAGLIRQASTAIAVADRLARAGVAPSEQAGLFAPATFSVEWPDPARDGPTRGTTEMIGQDMLSFGMTILIFMMIVMYGTWVATSVVEEKSSRVMEVILNAATPFQLLAGKVLGVGALALTQYAALLAVGAIALFTQGPVSTAILGETSTAVTLPGGLTVQFLLLFGVYGTLGFLLFAVLYAAAGSLVSRQEDVNAVVMPMTLVATAGYMVGVYAAMGLLDIRSGWLVALSQFPLLSPFMMLGRITTGEAAGWEIVLSVVLLALAIAAALWLASRIYAAGVLLYGQRPGLRSMVRLVRSGT